ncbi:hypothetical protein [Pandoraea communis]|nr:hypothetical protein [Pandoraea communis]
MSRPLLRSGVADFIGTGVADGNRMFLHALQLGPGKYLPLSTSTPPAH